mmetsp:Transcript_3718/g.4968  ORF Transcript_3718/g.4968 Transcript_3718/m.4968 type:complete len:87 (-) Transcript_3718:1422-1682(-)
MPGFLVASKQRGVATLPLILLVVLQRISLAEISQVSVNENCALFATVRVEESFQSSDGSTNTNLVSPTMQKSTRNAILRNEKQIFR